MDLLDIFGQHEITVTPPEGEGAWGPIPGTPVPLPGVWVMEKVTLVRNKAGDQVTSTAQIAVPLDTEIDPDGTTIKLPSGRETRVISVATANPGALPLPEGKIIYCE